MPDLSVIICTHNPRPDFLHRVLSALQAQTLPPEQWELLLIDNASKEPVAGSRDLSWHPRARHIREDELGLACARLRGMREAAADVLVFFDDDNVPEPSFLLEVQKINTMWPQLGVWGGSIVPEFQVAPLEHRRPYLSVLSLREVSSARWSNVPACDEAEPWGAGLCLRKRVAEAYRDLYQKTNLPVTGRRGSSLISGEDTEICMVACSLGLGMGLFPELKLVHLIPGERLEEDYLVKLTEGIRTSNYLIDYKWKGIIPPAVFSPGALFRHIRYVLRRGRIQRRIYMAHVKASLAAWRMIAASRS
jgi:glycosyltransferase involved in cell wall biosynthesis